MHNFYFTENRKDLLKTFFYPMLSSVMPKLGQAADKGLTHQEMHSLMKFLEMISRIRKPELAEDYMKFSEELDEEEEEPMLMREQVAMHKGKIEGRQEGISIGEIRGEIRGEKRGKLIAAHKLLARGVPMKLLAEGIGLSEKDIALLNRRKVVKRP